MSPPMVDRRLAVTSLLLGFVATLIAGGLDPYGVVHADDLTHYLFAKWSWRWPSYLLNDWGRPGFTMLYFPVANLGWYACRILSAVLTASAAWLAFRIARDLGLRAAWAVIPLCYVQPLVFKLAQTTLTETPLMFYLTLALFLAMRRRWTASAAIISLAFVTRHEAILFLPIWLIQAHREQVPLKRLWPILWAPIFVNALAPLVGVGTILTRFIDPSSSGQYGQGGWLTFFARSMEAWGPAISVLAIIGLRDLLRRPAGAFAATCAIVYFAGQTAIRALGLYDSGGYARFLVPISPIIAIAALAGWHELRHADANHRRRAALLAIGAMSLLWIAMERQLILYAAGRDELAELPEVHHAKLAIRIAAVVITVVGGLAAFAPRRIAVRRLLPATLLILIALTTYALCRPLTRPVELARIAEARQWLDEHGFGQRELLSANVWIDYLTNREMPPDRPSVRRQLSEAPVGTIFAWEKQFAGSPDHKLPLEEFACGSFRLLYSTPPLPFHTEPYLRLFEKIAPWNEKQPLSTTAPKSALQK